MRHEILAQSKICRRPTVSLCRDRSIVLPWMADQPTDSVYIIRAPGRFICFNKAKRSLPPAHEQKPCMWKPLFWKQATKTSQVIEVASRVLCFSKFERLGFIDAAHPISEGMLVELLWGAILKSHCKKGLQVKQDLHIDVKIIEHRCVSKSARNFASKVESRLNYPLEV